MKRLAMRINAELLAMAGEITGKTEGHEIFDELPYMIMTPVSVSSDKIEIKIEIMSEDQMVDEYKDDPELRIIN
jgi:hypothetical protein